MDYEIENPIGIEYAKSHGWSYKTTATELITACPLCSKEDHFYMNKASGLFSCKVCGEEGNIATLRKLLGDSIPGLVEMNSPKKPGELPNIEECHSRLMASEDSMDYLVSTRGWKIETIEKMRIGLFVTSKAKYIVYPYVNGGKYLYAKLRCIPPVPEGIEKFLGAKGRENPLFNADAMNLSGDDLIFVEGEGDCLALLSTGIYNVCGVPGANMKKAVWIDRIDCWWEKRIQAGKKPHIYILYDADSVGQKAAEEISKRIGIERCWNIKLPFFTKADGTVGKDANEWVRSFLVGEDGSYEKAREAFLKLCIEAQQFSVKGVYTLGAALDTLELRIKNEGSLKPTYDFPWESVNKVAGGAEPGDRVDIIAEGKVGKFVRTDARLLTPTGWTTIGKAKIGMPVASLDGKPSVVSGIYPQGVQESLRVTFSDGRSVCCGHEHLWTIGSVTNFGRDGWRTVDTDTLASMITGKDKWFIPLFCGEYGIPIELGIDPWLLGALLGDAGLTDNTPTFTKLDPLVVAEVRNRVEELCCVLKPRSSVPGNYRIACDALPNNPCTDALRALGLWGKLSVDKFLPAQIMDATRETRLLVLNGLMDTDGSPEGDYRVPVFNTSSRRLAEDVQTLVRSLGGIAPITSRIPTYTYNGHQMTGERAYRVYIKLNEPVFRYSNKATKECTRTRNARLTVTSIKPEGLADMVCIRVSHPSALYIVDDYITTHNTTFGLNWLDYLVCSKNVPCLLLCFEMQPERIARKWASLVTLTDDSPDTGGFTLDTITAAREVLSRRTADFILGYTSAQDKDKVFDLIKQAVRRYGIKVVMIDNLQQMVRSLQHAAQETSNLSKAIKDLLMELGLLGILIVQPKRVEPNEIVAARHGSGSAAIEKDCDMTIALHRNRIGVIKASEFIGQVEEHENFGPYMLARVDLTRYSPGGAVTLYMDGAKSFIRELNSEETRARTDAAKGIEGGEMPVEGQDNDIKADVLKTESRLEGF